MWSIIQPKFWPKKPVMSGQRHEDAREHGQPRGDQVQAVGGRLEVHVERLGQQLAAVGDEVHGEHEVVADVGERMVGLAGAQAEDPLDRVGAGVEHVALRDDHLQQAEQAAAHHHDAASVGVGRVLEGVVLELVDLLLDLAQERQQALREGVEDPVDHLVVGVRVGRADRLERLAAPAVDRDDAALGEVDVDLGRAVPPVLVLGAVEDDQQAVAVVVDLRALAELLAVLDASGGRPRIAPSSASSSSVGESRSSQKNSPRA
jgi:hypothetical protein